MNKKILLFGFIFVILIAVPLTIYLLSTQTKTQSKAAKSTNLTFSTLSGPIAAGSNFNLNVMLDPGQNQVSFVKLMISYDQTAVKRADPGISPNSSVFPVTLEGPTYDQCIGSTCTESITLSIGTEVTKAIQGAGSPVTIASVNFTALAPTSGNGTTINFANGTQVLSLASSDQPSENVLASATPATVTISAATTTTPSPPGGGGATDTPTPTTPGGGGTGTSPTPTTTAQSPICTSLTADNTSTASAPLPVLFTANGTSPNGTITKVTFNFGDGSVQDITSAGGIGTATVNAQVSHTYSSNGIFTANATLVDNGGNLSNPTTCSQTISVGSAALSATPTPTLPTNKPLPPTGPGQTFLLLGAIGAALVVFGGVLFAGL